MAKKKNNNANKAADAATGKESGIAQASRKQSLGPAKSGAGAISKGEKVQTATAAATVIRGAKHAHKNVGCGCACDLKDEGRLHKVREMTLKARTQWTRRYRVLKSLEMQQLRNRQKQLQAKLADAATTEEEKAGLHQQLDRINEDILYITHYPSDQRYISVAATKPEAVAKRDAIRQKLLAEVGAKQSEDQNGAETKLSDESPHQEAESKEEQPETSSAEDGMAVVPSQEDKSESEAKQPTEAVAEAPATTTQQTEESKPEAEAEPAQHIEAKSGSAEAAAETEGVKLTKSQKKRLKKRRSAQKALAAANDAAAPAPVPTSAASPTTTTTEAPSEPMKVDDLQQVKADVAPQAEAETVAETTTQEAQATTPVATKKRNRKATPTKPSTPQKSPAQAPSKAPARKKTKADQ